MNFRIADTFTSSLARLTGDEQKAVKTTAFDLQLNPANPSFSFHKLDKARDKNFWSVRVSRDIRLIIHRTADSLLLCYVDHHDDAYRWAERRRLQTHPTTGAAQWVQVPESFDAADDRMIRGSSSVARPSTLVPFQRMSNDELLGWGVPEEWLEAVRATDEYGLLDLASKLPGEAAEALLEIATGGTPRKPQKAQGVDPFSHPDAQRRFRVMQDVEELERALEYPWEQWTVFLHPAQREWVERDQSGPARVAGSAGTGKTIVALHRAVHLARADENARVLLTTFSLALSNALHARLRRLIGRTPLLAERIDVAALDDVAERLYRYAFGAMQCLGDEDIRRLLQRHTATNESALVLQARLGDNFLWNEWQEVVDPWQVESWEAYRDFKRLGRKTRLSEGQRAIAWEVFQQVRQHLAESGRITRAMLYTRLASQYAAGTKSPFEHIVVDEAQDLSVPQLRLLAALSGSKRNGLFFAGDLGQRIFQTPYSWKSLGVDIRGRARTLAVNYRTSHQIRMHADRLLDPEVSDVDGNVVDRRTVSVFNGPPPTIVRSATSGEESAKVAAWLSARAAQGVRPSEIAVFVRSEAQLERARDAVDAANLPVQVLDDTMDTDEDRVSIGTMHRAKGLEFRCVVVMACDDEVLPLQERMAAITDEGDLEEMYATERHLLYVACTRARDQLLVTGVEPVSEFLGDLN